LAFFAFLAFLGLLALFLFAAGMVRFQAASAGGAETAAASRKAASRIRNLMQVFYGPPPASTRISVVNY
jgi:hypothetical protein